MTVEQVITYIIIPIVAAVTGAIVGIWKIVIPAIVKRIQLRDEAEIETRRDSREYEQGVQSNAFNQVIEINRTLIHTLIDSHGKLETAITDLRKTLDGLHIPAIISDAKTQIEISNRDRVRMDEILADIDIELHEIKASLATISKEDSR